jgi:hypothetical protein
MNDFVMDKADSTFFTHKVDTTLFTHKVDKDIFVCQIYIDDIIFGSTDKKFCEEFSRIMTKRFEIFMIGDLKFFLGANEGRDFHMSNQVCEGYAQEV